MWQLLELLVYATKVEEYLCNIDDLSLPFLEKDKGQGWWLHGVETNLGGFGKA